MSIRHYCDICGDMIVNIKPNTELIMFNQGDILLDIKMDLCSECRIKIIEKIRDYYNRLYAVYHLSSDVPTPETEDEPKKWIEENLKKHVHRTDGSVLEYMPGDPK